MEAAELCLVGVLSIPHILYAFIWFRPRAFKALCGRDAVNIFARVSGVLKVIQFSAVYLWATQAGPVNLLAVTPARAAAAVVLGVLGQMLNVGIYRAIGTTGVYYGFKLGHKVPWVSGFPFNLGIRHPQYVGSVMTVWALVLLLWDPAVRPQLAQVGAAWTALYVVTGLIEDKTKGG